MREKTLGASVLAAAILSLAACGGGGDGPSKSAPNQAEAAPTPVAVTVYGDSTMIGYTYPDGPGQPSIITPLNAAFYMTSTLQQMGKPVVVTNNAVNGTEVGELLSGSNGYAAPWSQAVYGVSGKVVIANYGINDSFRGDETPEQYGRNLVTWVTVARDAGKTPVLEEPNPVCRSDISNLDAYVAQIGAVATQMNVPLIKQYDYIKSLPTWQSLLSDCIHPTPSLYQIKGQREAQVLASLIG